MTITLEPVTLSTDTGSIDALRVTFPTTPVVYIGYEAEGLVKRLNELARVDEAVKGKVPEAKPRWKHNCERCVFLGQVGGFDAYWCAQHPGYRVYCEHVIVRSENSYSITRPHLIGPDFQQPFLDVLRLARERGLVGGDEPGRATVESGRWADST